MFLSVVMDTSWQVALTIQEHCKATSNNRIFSKNDLKIKYHFCGSSSTKFNSSLISLTYAYDTVSIFCIAMQCFLKTLIWLSNCKNVDFCFICQ